MKQIKIGPVLFSVAALSILSWLCSTLRESDYGKVGVVQLIGCTLRWDQPIEPMDFHTRPSRGLMDETPASAGSSTRPWFDVVGHICFLPVLSLAGPGFYLKIQGRQSIRLGKSSSAPCGRERVPHGARWPPHKLTGSGHNS